MLINHSPPTQAKSSGLPSIFYASSNTSSPSAAPFAPPFSFHFLPKKEAIPAWAFAGAAAFLGGGLAFVGGGAGFFAADFSAAGAAALEVAAD